jgi:hypothetical protein
MEEAMTDNVYRLEQPNDLASRIRGAWKRCEDHHAGWRAAALEFCTLLAEARAEHESDHRFSDWLKANGLDDIQKDTRAAAIQLGQNPKAAERTLKCASSMSFRSIVRDTLPSVLQWIADDEAREARVLSAENPTPETPSPVAETPRSHHKKSPPNSWTVPKRDDTDPVLRAAIERFVPVVGHRPTATVLVTVFGYRDPSKDTYQGRLLGMFRALAERGGKPTLKELASLVDAYGIPPIGGNPATFGPHFVVRGLPKSWPPLADLSVKTEAMTLSMMRRIVAQLPKFRELELAVEVEKPENVERFCGDWWHRHVTSGGHVSTVERPVPPQLQAAIDYLAPAPAYSGSLPDPHYNPLRDEDIVVCGQVLYAAGSAPAATYAVLFATFQMWKHYDGTLAALTTQDVSNRGYEWRRSCPWMKRISPMAGNFLWQIGHAMAEHPERFAETSAAPKIPNVV